MTYDEAFWILLATFTFFYFLGKKKGT